MVAINIEVEAKIHRAIEQLVSSSDFDSGDIGSNPVSPAKQK